MTHAGLRTALAALTLLLSGCAALQPPLPPEVAKAQRTYHPTLATGGRLSVRYEGRTGPEALHGSFHWRQTPVDTRIDLLSPLGQTIARIAVTPAGATLQQAGQRPITAENADALTAQALGWPLPVAGLRDWLQGFGVDAKGRRFVASPRAESFITADGWLVQYPGWQETEAGTARPHRIDISRETPQAGEVGIRIVLDQWQPS